MGSATELRLATQAWLLDQVVPPHAVVNRVGDVVHQSAGLGAFLEPAAGAPTRDLLAMARRGLRLPLRAALAQAIETGQRAVRPHLAVEISDRSLPITLTVAPLPLKPGAEPLYIVLFDALGPTEPKRSASGRPGESASDSAIIVQLETELRETRATLHSTIEEYETATEDLRSANEELVSVNEELQSTNEEMETSKEELQSVNEELHTVNLELSQKLEQLDRANADLRNLFNSTEIATIFLDRTLSIRSFTPAATAIFTLVPGDRGRKLTDFASRLSEINLPAELAVVLANERMTERRVMAPESEIHYLMRILPYRDATGAVDGLVLTFLDVTKVVEGEVLGTLVDELNHRVRNMLQVVVSVAAHTLRRSETLAEFGTTFSGRIKALARAHELVSLGGWTDVSLQELAMKELRPYAAGTDRIVLRGPAVRLQPKAALPLCMVLHELATNAAKHGALSTDAGIVTLAWELTGEGEAARLILRWAETQGPRITAPPERRGFGSQLMERLLKHDLAGSIVFELPPGGLSATLSLPGAVLAGTRRGRLSAA
jgi:two-component system CheB/CheR fusion protein